MTKRNPALFYFWAHGGDHTYNPMDQLDTPILRNLMERSEVVFQEFVSWNLESTAELERDWNTYIRTGDMPSKLKVCISPSNPLEDYLFIANLMSKGRKRLMLEQYPRADFDFVGEDQETNNIFYESSLERAIAEKEAFLRKAQSYQLERESLVAEKIVMIPQTVLVIFGAGHPELPQKVALKKTTEIHYPYAGYPQMYETLMAMQFRVTGKVNPELYCRMQMENMSRNAIYDSGKKYTSRQLDLLAHHYATIMTPEHIVAFKDYMVSSSTLLVGICASDVFDSYLKKENLPPVEEAVARIQ